jgi:hypothetical protein
VDINPAEGTGVGDILTLGVGVKVGSGVRVITKGVALAEAPWKAALFGCGSSGFCRANMAVPKMIVAKTAAAKVVIDHRARGCAVGSVRWIGML